MNNFLTSSEITLALIDTGIKKASRPLGKMLVLSVLAGAYIGLAAHFATVAGWGEVPWIGARKLLMGAAFSLGLMLVMIPGAELFTGNTLMVVALMDRRISAAGMMKNWLVVYLGNFVGGLAVAAWIIYGTGLVSGSLAEWAVSIAAGKTALSGAEVFFRGIGANWLVCLAVMMGMASRDLAGRILGIFFPIMAFVAMGFEHSIANMYFLPAGLMLLTQPENAVLAELLGQGLTVGSSLLNLFWATLGNIVGGGLFVGMAYWYLEAPGRDKGRG
jgi:formate/nitrite transporter